MADRNRTAEMAELVPISIITGFLGSGKTTLLRRLLADPRMGTTAVLVNEFGEVGLDHLLLRKVDEEIVLLNSGCLCCGVRDDLVETLDDLRTKRRSGAIPDFTRVVIETTGLADPAPIIHTLVSEASLIPEYGLMGLVATVDASHGEGQLDRFAEAVKQAAMSDRLVITKTDLTDNGALTRLRSRLAALSPGAAIFDATLGAGPGPHELFDSAAFSADGKIADVRRWLDSELDSAVSVPSCVGEGGKQGGLHEPHRHDDRIGTFCLTADEPLDWTAFTQWLALLLANRGEQLLRIKGLINVAGRARPVVIHGVQHVFYPPGELDDWPDADRRSRIVFITRDLSCGALDRAFRKLTERRSRLDATSRSQ
ncbi:MAG: GTP-binding protein [Xanthobacteraceae bacterium]